MRIAYEHQQCADLNFITSTEQIRTVGLTFTAAECITLLNVVAIARTQTTPSLLWDMEQTQLAAITGSSEIPGVKFASAQSSAFNVENVFQGQLLVKLGT